MRTQGKVDWGSSINAFTVFRSFYVKLPLSLETSESASFDIQYGTLGI
jgi:hypothetical protein